MPARALLSRWPRSPSHPGARAHEDLSWCLKQEGLAGLSVGGTGLMVKLPSPPGGGG